MLGKVGRIKGNLAELKKEEMDISMAGKGNQRKERKRKVVGLRIAIHKKLPFVSYMS